MKKLKDIKLPLSFILITMLLFIIFNTTSLLLQNINTVPFIEHLFPNDPVVMGLPFRWLSVYSIPNVSPIAGLNFATNTDYGFTISTITLIMNFIAYYLIVIAFKWIKEKVWKNKKTAIDTTAKINAD